ncbi:MAG: PAS domain-containing protein, partial [Leptolyngbyaceae cyanobacterium SL_7_1]|nr:PAS domain-containing protein [Leptolyngbyaceae cyanobacterium SL_7_1]
AQLLSHFGDLSQINAPQDMQLTINGERTFVHVIPSDSHAGLNWLIVLALPEAEFHDYAVANQRRTLVLCLLGLLLSIANAALASRWILTPIRRLNDASQAIAQGDLPSQINPGWINELAVLITSFNQMMVEIYQSRQQAETYSRSLEHKVQERTQTLEQEIWERQRAETALQAANAELHALFNSMPELIFVLDKQGHHLKIPSVKPELLYKPEVDRVGKTLHEVLPQSYADLFLDHIHQALDTQQTVHIEYNLPIHDNTLWFYASISPIDDRQVIWVSTDITQRKQAEEALRQSEATNQALIKAIPDLLVQVHRDGTVLNFIHGDGIKLYNSVSESMDRNLYDLLPFEIANQRMEFIQRALETGELQVYEYELEIDGDLRHEEARIVVIGEDEVLIMVRDFTDRLNAEAALQQQLHRALLLKQITEKIRSKFDPCEIFETATQQIGKVFAVSQCLIQLQDEGLSHNLLVVNHYIAPTSVPCSHFDFLVDHPYLQDVLAQDQRSPAPTSIRSLC